MPISLKELNNLRAEVDVELYPGITSRCVYRLDAFNDEVVKLIDGATRGGGLTAVAENGRKALEKLLVSWEITDEKGKELPINADTLKRLNVRVIDRLLGAIIGDRDPNLIRGVSSGASVEA